MTKLGSGTASYSAIHCPNAATFTVIGAKSALCGRVFPQPNSYFQYGGLSVSSQAVSCCVNGQLHPAGLMIDRRNNWKEKMLNCFSNIISVIIVVSC